MSERGDDRQFMKDYDERFEAGEYDGYELVDYVLDDIYKNTNIGITEIYKLCTIQNALLEDDVKTTNEITQILAMAVLGMYADDDKALPKLTKSFCTYWDKLDVDTRMNDMESYMYGIVESSLRIDRFNPSEGWEWVDIRWLSFVPELQKRGFWF